MDISRIKNVHFVGIGGIGMSALARWFLAHGYEVSGSDLSPTDITTQLGQEGAKAYIGPHSAKNVPSGADLVVHTAATNQKNPEIQKALESNVSVRSYSQVIGDLTKRYKTLCVAGAHGKSTTSSILSLILAEAKKDPTVIVGTKVKEFNGSNFRNGKKKKYFVLESDEYSRAFLNYSPFASIITNIDKEHLDIYKDLKDIKETFLKFISNTKKNGILVLNKDNKNLYSLKDKIAKISRENNLKVIWYGLKDDKEIVAKIKKVIQVSGEHNLSNVLAVYLLSRELKISEKTILKAIGNYEGVWRRMDFRGKLKVESKMLKVLEVDIYDDYAHHPTEIKATLSALREKYPKHKIICVFQPHQAKRVKDLFKEFSKAFAKADYLILLDIYRVEGRDLALGEITSRQLVREIKNSKNAPEALYLNDSEKIKNALNKFIKANPLSVVVMMGAGNINRITDKLLK